MNMHSQPPQYSSPQEPQNQENQENQEQSQQQVMLETLVEDVSQKIVQYVHLVPEDLLEEEGAQRIRDMIFALFQKIDPVTEGEVMQLGKGLSRLEDRLDSLNALIMELYDEDIEATYSATKAPKKHTNTPKRQSAQLESTSSPSPKKTSPKKASPKKASPKKDTGRTP